MSRVFRSPTLRRALAAAGAVALGLASTPLAHAAPPPGALELCQEAPSGCAIRVADDTREGATNSVTVQGAPHVRVKLRAYQAIADGAELKELKPLGDGVEVVTNRGGIATVDLSIPAVVKDASSGWALISVDGVTGTDVSTTVGTFAPFGARIPTVLGDGFAVEKPVGVPLDLHVVGSIRGTRFAVEIEHDDGTWEDVTLQHTHVDAAPDEDAIVQYALPRGLTSTPKKLRLRNITDSSIDSIWLATPSADGTPAQLDERFVPPPVGDALDGTAALAAHPTTTVQVVGFGIAGASAIFVAAMLAADTVRRRRD